MLLISIGHGQSRRKSEQDTGGVDGGGQSIKDWVKVGG